MSETELENFETKITISVFNNDIWKIDDFVKCFPDRYENRSHFIRCAIQFYLRNCRKDWENKR